MIVFGALSIAYELYLLINIDDYTNYNYGGELDDEGNIIKI